MVSGTISYKYLLALAFEFIVITASFGQKSEYTTQAPIPIGPYRPYLDIRFVSDTGNTNINSENTRYSRSTFKSHTDTAFFSGLSHVLYVESELHLPTANDTTIFRFVWSRSFNGTCIIKLFQREGRLIIQYRWFKSLRTDTKELPINKLNEFKDILNQYGFWKMKPIIPQPMSTDGSAWLIEAQNGAQYRFVYRTNPDSDEKALFKIGSWLIQNSYCYSEIGEIY